MVKTRWLIHALVGLVILVMGTGCSIVPVDQGNPATQSLEDILNSMPVNKDTYFKTMQDVMVRFIVKNDSGQAIPKALVSVREKSTGDEIFRGLTNSAGIIEGFLSVSIGYSDLEVEAFSKDYSSDTTDLSINIGDRSVTVNLTLQPVVNTSGSAYWNSGIDFEQDTDGDSVPDFCDSYPDNPELAYKIPYAPHLVVFEDLFGEPDAVNDKDVNDIVVKVNMYRGVNTDYKVKRIEGTMELMARGANKNYASDYYLGLILQSTQQTVSYNVNEVKPRGAARPDTGTIEKTKTVQLLIFEDTVNGFETTPTYFINTIDEVSPVDGAITEFSIDFEQPFVYFNLTYDPYVMVNNPHTQTVNDIHMPFMDKVYGSENPTENNFIDPENFPYGMALPQGWKWPLERVRIDEAYPDFKAWVLSDYGSTDPTTKLWFLNPDDTKVYN